MSAKCWAFVILAVVIVLAGFIRWSEARAAEADAAYDRYQQCVQETYGVTVTTFYQTYGRAPKCGA